MRWTQQRRREACSQGGLAVSEQQRADERRFRLRQNFDGLALDIGEVSWRRRVLRTAKPCGPGIRG